MASKFEATTKSKEEIPLNTANR